MSKELERLQKELRIVVIHHDAKLKHSHNRRKSQSKWTSCD